MGLDLRHLLELNFPIAWPGNVWIYVGPLHLSYQNQINLGAKLTIWTGEKDKSKLNGAVVTAATSQQEGCGFDPHSKGLSVRSLLALPVSVWVPPGVSGFSPQSKQEGVLVYVILCGLVTR